MIAPHVVVPVKSLDAAKSRLDLPPDERRAVARSLAQHTLGTIASTLGGHNLTVVTADPSVERLATDLDANVVHDPDGDLNRAVQRGLSSVSLGSPVLVLVADLPRLNSYSLLALLTEVEQADSPYFVPDVQGTGTTAIYLPAGWRLPTSFGPNSASRFMAAGWTRARSAPIEARADLDTISDFELYGGHLNRSRPVYRARQT